MEYSVWCWPKGARGDQRQRQKQILHRRMMLVHTACPREFCKGPVTDLNDFYVKSHLSPLHDGHTYVETDFWVSRWGNCNSMSRSVRFRF